MHRVGGIVDWTETPQELCNFIKCESLGRFSHVAVAIVFRDYPADLEQTVYQCRYE